MSLFSWMFPARKAKPVVPETSGLPRGESAPPASRKHERMARRELLYAVVREAMVHAGVLSSSYKFKVLSLDNRGRQFLVMIDLSRDNAVETPRLADVESSIAQAARQRHDIDVTGVYWRMSEQVAVGDATQTAHEPATLPVAVDPVAPPPPLQSGNAQAASAGATATAFDGTVLHGPQSYTLLTGFEDTEIAQGETQDAPVLSGTQFGQLR